jgi:hypothetical protein
VIHEPTLDSRQNFDRPDALRRFSLLATVLANKFRANFGRIRPKEQKTEK